MDNRENMSEKQFLRIMNRSVLCIILCILALVRTSWAWYELSIMPENQITVGAFDARITVYSGQQELVLENGTYRLPSGEYLIQIETAGSIVPAHCQIYEGEICLESAQLPPGETTIIPLVLPEQPEHTITVFITVEP